MLEDDLFEQCLEQVITEGFFTKFKEKRENKKKANSREAYFNRINNISSGKIKLTYAVGYTAKEIEDAINDMIKEDYDKFDISNYIEQALSDTFTIKMDADDELGIIDMIKKSLTYSECSEDIKTNLANVEKIALDTKKKIESELKKIKRVVSKVEGGSELYNKEEEVVRDVVDKSVARYKEMFS